MCFHLNGCLIVAMDLNRANLLPQAPWRNSVTIESGGKAGRVAGKIRQNATTEKERMFCLLVGMNVTQTKRFETVKKT
jgi:hypothetical protein